MRRRIAVGPAIRVVGLAALAALALVLGVTLASRRDDNAVRAIPIGRPPSGLLLDPRTERIFVCDAADNTVDTIDERTGALLRATAVGFSPTMTVLDRRTGHVLVLDAAGIGMSILDAATGRLLGAVSLAASPVAMAVSTRTGHIFVATSDDTVDTLDGRDGTLLRTVAAGIAAGGHVVPTAVMAVDDRGGHVFVLDNDLGATFNGTVSVLDAASGRLVRRIVVGGEPTAVSVDERTGRAFVANGNSISVIDTRRLTLLRTVTIGSGSAPLVSGAPVVDAGMGRVYVATYTSGQSVSILDAANGRLLHTVALHSAPDLILVDAVTGRLFTVGADGIGVLDVGHGTLLGTIAEHWDYRLQAAIDARSGEVAVVAAPPGGPNNLDQVSGVTLFDGRNGNPLRGEIPTSVGPVALSIDERTGRAIVLNQGGVVVADDPWSWMPSGCAVFYRSSRVRDQRRAPSRPASASWTLAARLRSQSRQTLCALNTLISRRPTSDDWAARGAGTG